MRAHCRQRGPCVVRLKRLQDIAAHLVDQVDKNAGRLMHRRGENNPNFPKEKQG